MNFATRRLSTIRALSSRVNAIGPSQVGAELTWGCLRRHWAFGKVDISNCLVQYLSTKKAFNEGVRGRVEIRCRRNIGS
jgi:hypothetical protein